MHKIISEAINHYVFNHFFGVEDESNEAITELRIGGNHDNLIVGLTKFEHVRGFLIMNMYIPAYGQKDADTIRARVERHSSHYEISYRGANVKMPVQILSVYPPVATPMDEWPSGIIDAKRGQITHQIMMTFAPIKDWVYDSDVMVSSITAYILDVPTPPPARLVSSIAHVYVPHRPITYDHEPPIRVMILNADNWKITLEQLSADPKDWGTLHDAVIEKQDGSDFALHSADDIQDALDLFLSFQSNRWVTRAFTYTADKHGKSNVRMGKLFSRGDPMMREGVTSSREDWPYWFGHFYAAYMNDRDPLKRVIGGYVACVDIKSDNTLSLPWSLLPVTASSMDLSIMWCLGKGGSKNREGKKDRISRAIEYAAIDTHGDIASDVVKAVDRRNNVMHDMISSIGINDTLESAEALRSLSQALILQKLRTTPLIMPV